MADGLAAVLPTGPDERRIIFRLQGRGQIISHYRQKRGLYLIGSLDAFPFSPMTLTRQQK